MFTHFLHTFAHALYRLPFFHEHLTLLRLCCNEQDNFSASAIKKIFLEYATIADATKAERELHGRQFGSSAVQVTFFDEKDYSSRKLR